MNYYQTLDVSKDATPDDIKRSYKKLAKQYHPDLNKQPDAATKFKEVSEAFEVLGDEEKRRQYDLYGKVGGREFSGFGSPFGGSIFESVFGFGGQNRYQVAPDVELTCSIEFLDSLFGCKKEITIERFGNCVDCKGNGSKNGNSFTKCMTCRGSGMVTSKNGMFIVNMTCPTCSGNKIEIDHKCDVCNGKGLKKEEISYILNIPPAIRNGNSVVIRGMGNYFAESRYGNAICHINVLDHKLFYYRENRDVILKLPITYHQAVIGDIIEIPYPDINKVVKREFVLPPLTNHGTEFVIGKCNNVSNYVIITEICMPDSVSEEYINLLKENKLESTLINIFKDNVRDIING